MLINTIQFFCKVDNKVYIYIFQNNSTNNPSEIEKSWAIRLDQYITR